LKGGIEKTLKNDIEKLRKKFKINIFASCDEKRCKDNRCSNHDNVNFHVVHRPYITKLDTLIITLSLLLKILLNRRDFTNQIVHVHSNKSGFPAFLALKLLKAQLFVTIHFVYPFCVKGTLLKSDNRPCDFLYSDAPGVNLQYCFSVCFKKMSIFNRLYTTLSHIYAQKLLKRAEKVVVLCDDAHERLLNLGIDPNRIDEIGNEVFLDDLETPNAQRIPEKFDVSPNEKMVLYAGRISPEKGIETVITAMSKLPDNVKLVIAGKVEETDSYFRQLCRQISQLHLQRRVKFIGFLQGSRLSAAFKSCDVFVYPTLCYEMFGSSVLEALLCRKPVVLSNFGGLAKLLTRSKGAILVEPGNTDELAHALSLCLNDGAYAEIFARNGHSFVKALFAQENHFSRISALYEDNFKDLKD
jgi:glycosyltransferase involved in cell wall biosynthesis